MKRRAVCPPLAVGLGAALLLASFFVFAARRQATAAPALAPRTPAIEYTTWITTTASAPFMFMRFDAEYSLATGNIYFLGGRRADGTTDGSIWEFDPLNGNYTDTGVDMPVPVSNYEIARLVDGSGQEVLVTFGGRPAAGGVVNTVQGYYPDSKSVVTFDADPFPVALSAQGVEVVDNIAYVFGGFDAINVFDDTYIFDIAAAAGSRWTTGPNLGLGRGYIISAAVDGIIFAIGGDTYAGSVLYPQTIVERLDTSSPLAWDDVGVADLPILCDESQGFGFDSFSGYDLVGKVVVAGCGQWSAEVPDGLLYDVATDTWDALFPDLNEARRNHAGAFVPLGPNSGGRPGMWVFGGRQLYDSNVLDDVEYYDVHELTEPLACNSAGAAFESGIPPNWTVVDNSGGRGIAWTSTADTAHCSFANQTNGSGKATCADSSASGMPYDTALVSNPFDLTGVVAANLTAAVSYRDLNTGTNDCFEVDVWEGAGWTNLLDWDEDHEPGNINLDLSAYAGMSGLQVRFRYLGNGSDWYAQVDDVALACQEESRLYLPVLVR